MADASTILDQVDNFNGGPIAAARKRDSLARKEANATDDEQRMAYAEAVADLESRYPDIADVPIGGAEAFARERGHGSRSRSPVHHGRSRQKSPGAPKATPPRAKQGGLGGDSRAAKAKSKGTPGLDPSARRGKSSPKQPTPRVDRAIRQTGLPGAAESATSAGMLALGGTVAVSLFYLVVSSSEKPGTGAHALPSAIGWFTRTVHRFLSLQDVFPGPPAPAPAQGIAGLVSVEPNNPQPAFGAFHRGRYIRRLPQVQPHHPQPAFAPLHK